MEGENEKTKLDKRQKAAVFFIISALLILHLPTFITPHVEGDEVIYQILAEKTANNFLDYSTQGTGIVERTGSEIYDTKLFLHPPLFVWSLALLHKIGLGDLAVIIPVFSALMIVFLTFLIARESGFGNDALLAGAILAFDPILFFVSSKILIEAPLTALITLSVYLFLLAVRRRGQAGFFFLAGLVFGLAFMTKYMAITAGPVFLYIFWRKRFDLTNPLRKFLIFTLAAAAIIMPWLVYFSLNSGFGVLMSRQVTVEYLARVPFIRMVMDRPWHTFFSGSLFLAPVYFISCLGIIGAIRRGRGFFPAVWGLSVFALYTAAVLFTQMAGYSLRFLAPATPAMALLAAQAVGANKKLVAFVWPLAFIGLAGGLFSVYWRPGIGDVFSIFEFIRL